MELPHEDDLRWIISRYAHLLAEHGEGIGTPELVEPNGNFFPDELSASPEGVATLARRMLSYAPVSDELHLELAFWQDESGGGGGCGSGACGTGGGANGRSGLVGDAREVDGGYRLTVPVRDVGDPVLLATTLARCTGGVVLGEAGEEAEGAEHGPLSEIAAVASGLGLLLLNGACVYTKGCGGLKAHQGTHLDVASCAVALALFVRVNDAKAGRVRAHLETTQAEAFDEALRWVDSNEAIVAALKDHPASLADGVFPLEPIKGALSRLFGGKAARPEDVAPLSRPAKPARVRSEAEQRRIDETKALVEAALRGD
jgi:hypothetical protein